MKAIVNVAVCAMYEEPARQSTVVDEVLYGMVVEVLEETAPGWLKIRTHYRYEGIVSARDLILDQERVAWWEGQTKKVVYRKNCCDVLSQPKVQGWHLMGLVRGCLLSVVDEAREGWQPVQLADGRQGYVQASLLDTHYTRPFSEDEDQLRRRLIRTAWLYLDTHYRWGGKSPLGIDCSGFVSMVYMLNGIHIYRDADIREGFPIREIPFEEMEAGDLMYFPGHVAMYMGNNEYIHSTGRAGDDGVVVNSFDVRASNFRADLIPANARVGSCF